MFTQCPAIGADTGCAILLTIHQDGTVTEQTDLTNQPPYDGTEDTLVGVQNNSKQDASTRRSREVSCSRSGIMRSSWVP